MPVAGDSNWRSRPRRSSRSAIVYSLRSPSFATHVASPATPLADRAHSSHLWIAASAILIAAPLVNADHIFDATPGLQLAG
jgi:hypothetical protein